MSGLIIGILWGLTQASAHDDWIVDQWGMRDGLPQNSITDILQAHDGYIWVTTYGGIARFDGREFVVYHRGNTPHIGARFTSIAQSPDGTLWFGSEDQGLFRLRDGALEAVGEPMKIWDLASDAQGRVWVAGATQLLQVTPGGLAEVPGTGGARELSVLDDGAVIASGANGQIWCVAGDCEDLSPPVMEGDGTSMWFRAPSGAIRFSSGARVYEQTQEGWRLLLDGPEHSVFPLRCTRFRGEQFCAQSGTPFSLETPRWGANGAAPARALLVDRSGGIWVGTDGDGLLYYQHRDVKIHHNRGVFSVVEAPDGTIWFTTSRRSYHIGPSPPPWGEPTAFVWSSRDGEVLAIQGDRLWRVSAAGVQEQVGGWSEVSPPVEGPCFVDRQILYTVPPEGPPQRVVDASALDASEMSPLRCGADGGAWVMLDKARLVRLQGAQIVEDITVGEGMLIRDVLARGGWLWAASYGEGLLAIRDGAVQATLTPNEGMCDYAVSRLFERGEELWINTNRGIGKVPWAVLLGAVTGGSTPLQCQHFESGEGNGSSGVMTDGGVLWVPTIDGVAEVHPNHLQDSQQPLLYIDAVRYAQEPVADGASVAGPGMLDVQFVGLYYTDPHAVLYRYRLAGEGREWSEPSPINRVRYAGLRPGRYRFEVQARGRSGLWSEPVSFAFSRVPLLRERLVVRVGIPLIVAVGIMLGLVLGLRQSRRQNQRLAREIADRQRVEEALRRKQVEVDHARRAREAGQRLEGLGRLAGGIAHDFNNLLTVLSVHTALLAEHWDPEVRAETEGLLDVLDRATALTRQLLVFGRGISAPVVVELGAAVEALLPLLERLIRADITLQLELSARCGVRIDPGRLEQIVSNLVLNARDAISHAGTIRLLVGVADGQAELQVIDDGVGMSPETAEHIFEPYFTTKALGDGTGLGMATVHGAVEEAGGSITVHSTPGQGSVVRVRLPLCPIPSPPATPSAEEQAPVDTLRVLIVDDRPEVLKAVAALTIRLGWTVAVAGDLTAAVEAAQKNDLDLLLTDVVMPGGDGAAVQAAVRALQPGLPTVFMTGYAEERRSLGEGAVVLRKPFREEDLLAAVRRALGQTS